MYPLSTLSFHRLVSQWKPKTMALSQMACNSAASFFSASLSGQLWFCPAVYWRWWCLRVDAVPWHIWNYRFRLGVFQIAGTAALWGLVSGASHHDVVWPYYITFLLSAALILEAKFGGKSAREQHLVSEVFCICQGPLRIWHVFNAAAGEQVTPE